MNVVLRLVKSLSGPPRAGVEVGGAWPRFADPAGVSLRRDGVPEVLQAVQDVHGAVLDAVLVPCDQAAAGPAVVGVLAGVVEQVGAGVQPLDRSFSDRTVVAEPDRARDHEDVGGQHLRIKLRPGVGGRAVLGHVGPHAGRDVMVDGADRFCPHALLAHDRGADIDQPLRVAALGRRFQGAIDKQRIQVVVALARPGH